MTSKRKRKLKAKIANRRNLIKSRIIEDEVHRQMNQTTTNHEYGNPRTLREIMAHKRIMLRGQMLPRPQPLMQSHPHQAAYQNLRDKNDLQQREMADYAKLKEEERNRQKSQAEEFKAMKKENKRLQLHLQEENRLADQADKFSDEKQKLDREIADAKIRIHRGNKEQEVQVLRGDRDKAAAQLEELKMKEIDIKAKLESDKIGQENVLMEQENKRRAARIKAGEQLLASTHYANACAEHTKLYADQLDQEEQLRHQEQTKRMTRERLELVAKTDAHKNAQKTLEGREKTTAKEISDQVEKAATAEYNYQVLQDKYNQHEEQKRLLNRTRMSAQESELKLERLKKQQTQLEADSKTNDAKLKAEMLTKAQTDLKVEHQAKLVQLQRQKRDKDNELHVADQMLKYVQSTEYTGRLAQSEAIALQNEVLERDKRAKQNLETQIEKHNRLHIGKAVAKYAEESGVDYGLVMNNISGHIGKIDVPETIKPFVVEQAIQYSEDEVNRRVAELTAYSNKFEQEFGEEEINDFKHALAHNDLLDSDGDIPNMYTLSQTKYDRIIGQYQVFWATRRGDKPLNFE
jgi:hypothetical protein